MSGWGWLVMLGLSALAMADIYLLREAVHDGLRVIDGRRIQAVRELEADVAELRRKLGL